MLNDVLSTLSNYLVDYRYALVVALSFLLVFLLDRSKGKAKLNALMLTAKIMAKNEVLNSGEAQENWVVDMAYKTLPGSWTLFIPRNKMKGIVHYLYLEAKDYLDDGKLNGSENNVQVTPAPEEVVKQILPEKKENPILTDNSGAGLSSDSAVEKIPDGIKQEEENINKPDV